MTADALLSTVWGLYSKLWCLLLWQKQKTGRCRDNRLIFYQLLLASWSFGLLMFCVSEDAKCHLPALRCDHWAGVCYHKGRFACMAWISWQQSWHPVVLVQHLCTGIVQRLGPLCNHIVKLQVWACDDSLHGDTYTEYQNTLPKEGSGLHKALIKSLLLHILSCLVVKPEDIYKPGKLSCA